MGREETPAGHKENRSFLSAIHGFDPTRQLHKTTTTVTLPNGTRYHGNRQMSSTSMGFVVDESPDQELAEIMPQRLYLSSQDGAHDWDELQRHGITHILNVAYGVPNLFENDKKMVYKTCQMLDVPETDIADYFDECFGFIDDADGRVLVHCNAGVSRSSTICIAYLMTKSGLPLEDAYQQVKKHRPQIRPNDGFEIALRNLDGKLALQRRRQNEQQKS